MIPGLLRFVLVGKGGSRQVTLTLGALWDPQPSDHMHVNLSARQSLPYVDLTDCGDLKKNLGTSTPEKKIHLGRLGHPTQNGS